MVDQPSSRSGGRGATIWALVAGLAVGFAVGRETAPGGGSGGSPETAAEEQPKSETKAPERPSAAAPAPAAAKAPERIYKRQADFPPTWLKEADLASVGVGTLNETQKVIAIQALHERDCECGCNMGSLAICIKKDPNCPRSPVLGKLAVEKAKEGKSLTEVMGAIDARQKQLGAAKPAEPQAAAKPSGPRKIELAAWSPRKGPKAAKVTIVEWSDFQ